QRRGETSQMCAAWLNGNILTIPASATKNGRQSVIPVPQLAVPLIQTLTPLKWFWKHKARLDAASGAQNWCHHDLRRTYATTMQRLGARLEVTEKLLNHVSGSTAGIVSIYQRHDFFPEMKEAIAKYETWLIS